MFRKNVTQEETWERLGYGNEADPNDHEYEDGFIEEVTKDEKGYELSFKPNGSTYGGYWTFLYSHPSISYEPQVGDKIRIYGRGFGSVVRGIVINGYTFRYNSPSEEKRKFQRELELHNQEQKDEFESQRADIEERIAKLPIAMQQKLFGHTARAKDYAWKFLKYDLFVCEEAVKIIEHFQSVDEVLRFSKLDYDKQNEEYTSEKSGEHSGNTWGAAVYLAWAYLDSPKHVPQAHSAIHAIVGCEEAGCWAATDEAKEQQAIAEALEKVKPKVVA